jgi:hypothetical protein
MPQQSYHHHNNMMNSASATASKTPPKKASTPVKSYSTSLKKGVEESKLGRKIINVTYPDNTPFGWAFDNFYDAKDFVKHYLTGMANSPYLVA